MGLKDPGPGAQPRLPPGPSRGPTVDGQHVHPLDKKSDFL